MGSRLRNCMKLSRRGLPRRPRGIGTQAGPLGGPRGDRALVPIAIAVVAALTLADPAAAQLKPEEVALVAARGNRESEDLAAYYLKARGIPAANLCLVDVGVGEQVNRDDWTWGIRPEIHKWLDENDPQQKLRCLVTMRGVPLKIGAAKVDEEQTRYREFLEGDRQQRLDNLKVVGKQLDALAPHIAIPGTTPGVEETPAAGGDVKAVQAELEQKLRNAQARIGQLTGEEFQTTAAKLQQLALTAGGARVLLSGMEQQLQRQPSPELRERYDVLRGRTAGMVEFQAILEQMPPGYYHDALILAALDRNGGLLASVEWLDKQLATVGKNETQASLDSELSLVLWPDDYELLRWQPNYQRAVYANSQWLKAFPTIMVSRIDGPTQELAKGLIDAAIRVEAEGLQGKAYFDARGLAKPDGPAPSPGSYEDYDRAVVATANAIRDQTTIQTTLNTSPVLFQPGECPDAALYCGWYSLGKYVDAFEWRPGAVAYHLASGEARTLHEPQSEAWCKRLIEDGVAATIGPAYEPYLLAFPRPEQFFSLLLEGKLTLVECYWKTLPVNSWMMVLVGDPLYRPFKNRDVRKAGVPAVGGDAEPAAPQP
jgi:uncharacterized protein (TIGR03790 family)